MAHAPAAPAGPVSTPAPPCQTLDGLFSCFLRAPPVAGGNRVYTDL